MSQALVAIRRSDYKTGPYNGDVGIALLNRDGHLRVWFEGDDGLRAFLPSAPPAHDTVYAMTIHKSQGSEFNSVTLVLPDYDVPVMTRELFYTGLTRGLTRLVVFAAPSAVQRAVSQRVTRDSAHADQIGHGD